MPGLRFGLMLGTRRFGALVGHRRAREVLEQTRTISATEALELGLVTGLINEAERARRPPTRAASPACSIGRRSNTCITS